MSYRLPATFPSMSSSSSSSSHSTTSNNVTPASPSLTLVLTIILLLSFFIGFFSIYFCRCLMASTISSGNLRHTASAERNVDLTTSNGSLGLDASLIQFYPTFIYSSVKEFRREKYGVECAICLGEFVETDMLRLLTVCYHVFHQECIDLWLESHQTCPVCRGDLNLPKESLEKTAIRDQNNNNHSSGNVTLLEEHAISIPISVEEAAANGEDERSQDDSDDSNKYSGRIISRSHSTGHSLISERDEEEDYKYTMRLRDHVKIQIQRRHCTTGSCITFGDFSGDDQALGCSSTEPINKV